MNNRFLTQILYLNLLKRWCGNIYSTYERNYQTFNKIQAKSSFGRHVDLPQVDLMNFKAEYVTPRSGAGKTKDFSKSLAAMLPSNMAANTNHATLLKNQSAIKYLP